MDFSRIVVRDAAHSKAVLWSRITFLRLAKTFRVSNFNVTACRSNVLLLLYRHLSWTEVRRKASSRCIDMYQGRIHRSICGPRFGYHRAFTGTRTSSNVDGGAAGVASSGVSFLSREIPHEKVESCCWRAGDRFVCCMVRLSAGR